MTVSEVDSALLPPLKNDPTKTNWWEKVGGLPDLVTRVAKHLVSEQGKTESTAIATAISQVRKVCATGRTFGGRVAVHPDTKAEYCKAAAEIEAKRAAAKAKGVGKAVASDHEMTAEEAASLAIVSERKLAALAESLGPDWIMEALYERDFSEAQRKRAARKKFAMPDGSFPIESVGDLKNAVKAIGRAAKDKRDAVKAHIKKRARALGASNSLPSNWAMAEEISEEIIALNAIIEVFGPAVTESLREEIEEAFVIPPLSKLRATVKANRAADKAKSKSSSSSSGQKRAPKGTSNGGQFISTGGSGAIITGIRKKLGVPNAGGTKTKSRIEEFQKNHGLTVDGIIGRQTATALLTGGKKKVAVGSITERIEHRLKRRFG